ncbi:serine/threonine protein kinase [Sorangium sp. So ce1078]|uniref:serine/threonine protein kinase n=1 Tax=Sorangium sp. So ce1078 TaxID=3133329 RepID=UPI003F61D2F5
MQLLEASKTAHTPDRFLADVGEIFAMFDERTQDSGNVSYGVETEAGRFFVKTAGAPASKAFLSHEARVFWLRNAVRLSALLQDPALCRLRNVVESAHGPMLVYDWASGELIGAPRERRGDPTSAFVRFKHLPLPELTTALTSVFRFHAALCARGWIASDFYDGAMMYDFGLHEIKLMDLDLYREGPFVNDMGRMFGSTRFMAPEEFVLGARIDESTTVFTMGRCIRVFLADRLEQGSPGAPSAILSVAERACRERREARWSSMREFLDEWLRAVALSVTGAV